MSESREGRARTLIDRTLRACGEVGGAAHFWDMPENDLLKAAAPDLAREVLLALVAAFIDVDKRLNELAKTDEGRRSRERDDASSYRWALKSALGATFEDKALPLVGDDLEQLAAWLAGPTAYNPYSSHRSLQALPYELVVGAIERFAKSKNELSPTLKEHTRALIARLSEVSPQREATKLRTKLEKLAGFEPAVDMNPGEAWSDAALHFLASADEERRKQWNRLLAHCQQAGAGPPTQKWLKDALAHLRTITEDAFTVPVLEWLALVEAHRTRPPQRPYDNPLFYITDSNQQILKGLIQCVSLCDGAKFVKPLTTVALASYAKIPRTGPRAIRVGNACVWTLARIGQGELPALCLLRVRVKARAGQKALETALTEISERTGVSLDDLDELGVPAYGFDEVGVRREPLGDFSVELTLSHHGRCKLSFSSQGKQYESAPAALKKDHKEDLAELKETAEDVETMLAAQRQRLDGLFVAGRRWTLAVWRERYLDHPLLGVLARRLIWTLQRGSELTPVLWLENAFVDVTGQTIAPPADSDVALWHPIEASIETVMAWREFLEKREIQQPFKQAHREVYLLTSAERDTATYSNRFAAHLVKQHAFNALCGERGWKTSAHLQVDADLAPPTRDLRSHGLRAEFWVASVGEETNDIGTFLHLSTDQVRFYPRSAALNKVHARGGSYSSRGADQPGNRPVPLELVPPIVFSEVLRDVDLFVSVTSVGNDPTWTDQGRHVEHRDYWESFGFGELGEQAKTRHVALERLLPRLTIRDQCHLTDRFLVVKGRLATYEIHVGSGNVRMLPSRHHLCIAPAPKAVAKPIYLPFDDDGRLAAVISKAMLLARDDQITDTSIASQIRRGLGIVKPA